MQINFPDFYSRNLSFFDKNRQKSQNKKENPLILTQTNQKSLLFPPTIQASFSRKKSRNSRNHGIPTTWKCRNLSLFYSALQFHQNLDNLRISTLRKSQERRKNLQFPKRKPLQTPESSDFHRSRASETPKPQLFADSAPDRMIRNRLKLPD